MKPILLTAYFIVIALASFCQSNKPVVKTDTKKTTTASVSQEDMMRAWQLYMTPGKEHQAIAKDDGEWSETVTMWMAPGAPAQTTNATAVNKMILGGRFVGYW